MAERKRPSTDDENSETQTKKIKLVQTTLPKAGASTKPLCRYGAKCYRKQPDHLRAFRHPSPEKEEVEVSTPKPTKATSKATTTVSLMELAELDGEKLLDQLYQMEFPSDLYEFWKFCSSLDSKNPRGQWRMDRDVDRLDFSRGTEEFAELGTGRPIWNSRRGVEELQNRAEHALAPSLLLRHSRVPHGHSLDRQAKSIPSRLLSVSCSSSISRHSSLSLSLVLETRRTNCLRSSPRTMPVRIIDSRSVETISSLLFSQFDLLTIRSLFIHRSSSYARQTLKSTEKNEFLPPLEAYAKKHAFALEETTAKITARKKRINCTLLSSLGMVVPVENDIGYRPVQLTKGTPTTSSPSIFAVFQ